MNWSRKQRIVLCQLPAPGICTCPAHSTPLPLSVPGRIQPSSRSPFCYCLYSADGGAGLWEGGCVRSTAPLSGLTPHPRLGTLLLFPASPVLSSSLCLQCSSQPPSLLVLPTPSLDTQKDLPDPAASVGPSRLAHLTFSYFRDPGAIPRDALPDSALGSLLAVLRVPGAVPGIEPRSATCKVSASPPFSPASTLLFS